MVSDSGSQFYFFGSWTVMQHDKVNPILNGGGIPPKLFFSIAQKLLGVGS